MALVIEVNQIASFSKVMNIAEANINKIIETAMHSLGSPFGTVVNSGSAAGSGSWGIGGDISTIWYSNQQDGKVYELSPTDFSTVRSAASPYARIKGIGGDSSKIWFQTTSTIPRTIGEINTSDLSIARVSLDMNDSGSTGIGGDSSRIWYCGGEFSTNAVRELSTTDLSVLRSVVSPTSIAYGIGGTKNRIWYCDAYAGMLELDPSDFAVLKTHEGPSATMTCIGGDDNVIWSGQNGNSTVYRLGTE